MADNKRRCGFGTYVAYCDCLFENINELTVLLTSLVSSYRLLVGSAEEFNRITLAHKGDLEDAIDRADDLGDIIDKVICRLDRLICVYLEICVQEILCPDLIPTPGAAVETAEIDQTLEEEITGNLEAAILTDEDIVLE